MKRQLLAFALILSITLPTAADVVKPPGGTGSGSGTAAGSLPELLSAKRWGKWWADAVTNGTPVSNIAGSAAALVESGTQIGSPFQNGKIYFQYGTATTAGSSGGWELPQSWPYFASQPDVEWEILTPSLLTSVRIWAAVSTGSLASYDDESSSYKFAGFRYSTSADGTLFWRTVSRDAAGAGNSTTTVTTAPIAVSTKYKLRMRCTPTAYFFYVNDELVATHTTHIPSNNVDTSPRAFFTVTTLVAAAREWFGIHSISIIQ